jgi:hypothetical protein
LSNGFGNSAANNSNSFGQVRFNGEQMHTASHKFASASSSGKAVDSGSILGSARNPYSKQPEKPTMNSIVNLPQFGETDIATAIYLGFIEHDPATGGFKEVPQSSLVDAQSSFADAQEQQQTPSNPKAEAQAQKNDTQRQAWVNNPVDPETKRYFDEFDMVYGEQFTDAVIAITIDELTSGKESIDISKFEQYASRARMEPEQILNRVGRIVEGFQDQAVRYIQRNHPGVNGKEVINWLISGQINQDNAREILNRHIYHHDLTVYDDVVQAFKAYNE